MKKRQIHKILKLLDQGANQADICKKYDITIGDIRRWRKESVAPHDKTGRFLSDGSHNPVITSGSSRYRARVQDLSAVQKPKEPGSYTIGDSKRELFGASDDY